MATYNKHNWTHDKTKTNENMTQWTREPMAKRHEGKGSMNQPETITKLQNKRHENNNMEQNKKQTLHIVERSKCKLCMQQSEAAIGSALIQWYTGIVKMIVLKPNDVGGSSGGSNILGWPCHFLSQPC